MKTDRVDARKLVHMRVRACAGEADVWREVRVPTLAVEAACQVSRERTALTQEQTRLVNQRRSWLATMGVALPKRRPDGWWTTVRDRAGERLPGPLPQPHVHARLRLVAEQIAGLEIEQHQATLTASAQSAVRRLVQLKGIATTSAAVLIDDGLVWRGFTNRRQVGGLLGFAPLKYESGDRHATRGSVAPGMPGCRERWCISRTVRYRKTRAQLAWSWLW
jgi:transposase